VWRRPDKKTALRDIQALLDAREWLPFDGAEFFAVVEKDAAAAREWAQRAAAIRGRLLAAERDGVRRALGTKDGFAALIAALGEAGRAAAIAFGSDKGAGADADDDGAAAETAAAPNAGAGAASASGADFDEATWLARCLDAAAAAARGRIDALLPLVKVRRSFLLFVCCFVFSFSSFCFNPSMVLVQSALAHVTETEEETVVRNLFAEATWVLAAVALLASGEATLGSLKSIGAQRTAIVTQLGECSFIYRYISRESCSQFDSLPLTSLTIALDRWGHRRRGLRDVPVVRRGRRREGAGAPRSGARRHRRAHQHPRARVVETMRQTSRLLASPASDAREAGRWVALAPPACCALATHDAMVSGLLRLRKSSHSFSPPSTFSSSSSYPRQLQCCTVST
jgi:hypothetical protein